MAITVKNVFGSCMRYYVGFGCVLLIVVLIGCTKASIPFTIPKKIDRRFVCSCNSKVFYKEFVRKKAWVVNLGDKVKLVTGKPFHQRLSMSDTSKVAVYLDDYSALELYQIPYCSDTVYPELVKCERHIAKNGQITIYSQKDGAANNYWLVLDKVHFADSDMAISDTVYFGSVK
jgi:hypothetical protein